VNPFYLLFGFIGVGLGLSYWLDWMDYREALYESKHGRHCLKLRTRREGKAK
jgi:hypothetical protein